MHLMHSVRVDINEWAEGIYRVDLAESVDKPVLLICSQYAVIAAYAQPVGVAVLTLGRWLVVLLARFETGVVVWMRNIDWRPLRRVVSVDTAVGILRVVRRTLVVVVVLGMVVIDVPARLVLRPTLRFYLLRCHVVSPLRLG